MKNKAATFLNIEESPSNIATDRLMALSENKDYHRGTLKQYLQTTESGNQTMLLSSTSVGDKDLNNTLTGNGAIEIVKENADVFSRLSTTHGSREWPSVANSRSSRRRQVDEMEFQNLRAKKKEEQPLQEVQLELKQEREEMEL